MSAKITLKIVRSFSLGFSVFSPSLNGFYIELYFACFHVSFWNRPKRLFICTNYWSC